MSVLDNLQIEEISIVSDPANELSLGKLTKSASLEEVEKSEDEEKQEEAEEKEVCPECEGKGDDCICAEKAEDDAEDKEDEPAKEEEEEESDKAEDEVEEKEVGKSVESEDIAKAQLEKIAKMEAELSILKAEKVRSEKIELLKSHNVPSGLMDELSALLVKSDEFEPVVIKLLDMISALKDISKAYDVVGGSKEISPYSRYDKAEELVKSGKAKNIVSALAMIK